MQIGTARVRVPSTADPVLLVPIADTHVGARDADLGWLESFAKAAGKRDDTVVVLLGDHGEHIGHHDRRFSPEAVCPSFSVADLANLSAEETRRFLKAVAPLKRRTAVVMKGNHEWAMERQGSYDPHAELCAAWKARRSDEVVVGTDDPLDFQACGLLRLSVERGKERHAFSCFLHHGFFHGAKPNKVRHLTRLVHEWDADLVVVGHGHDAVVTGPIVRPRPSQRWDAIEHRESLGVMCASWKTGTAKGISTFEERSGFDRRVFGPTVIRIWPAERTFEVAFGRRAQAWVEQ